MELLVGEMRSSLDRKSHTDTTSSSRFTFTGGLETAKQLSEISLSQDKRDDICSGPNQATERRSYPAKSAHVLPAPPTRRHVRRTLKCYTPESLCFHCQSRERV